VPIFMDENGAVQALTAKPIVSKKKKRSLTPRPPSRSTAPVAQRAAAAALAIAPAPTPTPEPAAVTPVAASPVVAPAEVPVTQELSAPRPSSKIDEHFSQMEQEFFRRAEELYATSFESWEDLEPTKPGTKPKPRS
jgi:hypothetical protein